MTAEGSLPPMTIMTTKQIHFKRLFSPANDGNDFPFRRTHCNMEAEQVLSLLTKRELYQKSSWNAPSSQAERRV